MADAEVCGDSRILLNTVMSCHVDNWACVWVGVDVNELFHVHVGLSQGCVILQWLD